MLQRVAEKDDVHIPERVLGISVNGVALKRIDCRFMHSLRCGARVCLCECKEVQGVDTMSVDQQRRQRTLKCLMSVKENSSHSMKRTSRKRVMVSAWSG